MLLSMISRPTTRKRLLQAVLVPSLILAVALPSWTAISKEEALSIEEARDRYMSLDDSERALIHERYEHFSALTPEEREDLRTRGRNLARISRETESQPLPPEVSTKLNELPPQERRKFQRSILREELREKGRRFLEAMPENSRKELVDADGARARSAFMRRYKHENINRILNEMISRMARKLEVPQEEVQRILALRKGERLRAFLELNVGLTEEEMIRVGLPFGITPEQWEEWRNLSGEEFFAAVVRHREEKQRQRLARRMRKSAGGQFEKPSPEKLTSLIDLLDAVRKRPRDFVELADFERGRERRLELGKRKRALCEEVLRSGALLSGANFTELGYMSDSAFFGMVRRVIAEAGGAERIEAWIAEQDD